MRGATQGRWLPLDKGRAHDPLQCTCRALGWQQWVQGMCAFCRARLAQGIPPWVWTWCLTAPLHTALCTVQGLTSVGMNLVLNRLGVSDLSGLGGCRGLAQDAGGNCTAETIHMPFLLPAALAPASPASPALQLLLLRLRPLLRAVAWLWV